MSTHMYLQCADTEMYVLLRTPVSITFFRCSERLRTEGFAIVIHAVKSICLPNSYLVKMLFRVQNCALFRDNLVRNISVDT